MQLRWEGVRKIRETRSLEGPKWLLKMEDRAWQVSCFLELSKFLTKDRPFQSIFIYFSDHWHGFSAYNVVSCSIFTRNSFFQTAIAILQECQHIPGVSSCRGLSLAKFPHVDLSLLSIPETCSQFCRGFGAKKDIVISYEQGPPTHRDV